jgi:hypothetical protein
MPEKGVYRPLLQLLVLIDFFISRWLGTPIAIITGKDFKNLFLKGRDGDIDF